MKIYSISGNLVLMIFLITAPDMALGQKPIKVVSDSIERTISLKVKDIHLERLLENLLDNEIPVAYGTDNISGDRMVSIAVDNVTWFQFFELLCRKTGLSYEYVEGYFIIKSTGAVDHYTHWENGEKEISPFYRNVQQPSRCIRIALKELPNQQQRVKPEEGVIKPAASANFMIKKRRKRFYLSAIGAFYALDAYQFHFKPGQVPGQYYASDKNTSIGSVVIFSIKKSNFSISSGLTYTPKIFRYEYNYLIIDLQDPVPIPETTTVQLHYVQIPLILRYRFLRSRNWSAHLSLGFSSNFLVEQNEKTSYLNSNTEKSDTYALSSRTFLMRASTGCSLTIRLLNVWRFFIAPRYIRYLREVNTRAMKSRTTQFQLKAGMRVSIVKKTKLKK